MPFATLTAARPDASPAMYVVAVAVYGAGSIICHQLPGRTFHVGSAQMPVCARCTGIYAGAAMAAAVLLAARGHSPASHRGRRGAPLTRRDDREYREYVREEQRRQRGCIAGRMQADFHHGLLDLAPSLERLVHRHFICILEIAADRQAHRDA